MKKKVTSKYRNITNISFIVLLISQLLLFYIKRIIPNSYYIFYIIPYIVFIMFSLLYIVNNKNRDKRIYVFLIIAFTLFIRVLFAIRLNYDDMQHDFEYLNTAGTLGYIYTIFNTGGLPFSNVGQFYHPPLFYIICALMLRINTMAGISLPTSVASLEIVAASISMVTVYIQYKLIDKLKLNNVNKLLFLAFLCLHNSMTIMSHSINTDVLVTMFLYLTIYLLLIWNEKPNTRNTILLALSTGLAVMTKFSAALLAVPILVVFILKLINNKKNIKDYLKKYILFGAVSVPIGVWYELRNIMLFDKNVILTPAKDLYVDGYSVIDRFLSIDFKNLFDLNFYVNLEYNIPSFLIKSSILGEYNYENMRILLVALLIVTLVLIAFALYSIISYLIKKKEHTFIGNLLLVIYFTFIIGYISFNKSYPYSCTMDFRYIVITLLPSGYFIFWKLEQANNKLLTYFIRFMILLFIILCIVWVIRLQICNYVIYNYIGGSLYV